LNSGNWHESAASLLDSGPFYEVYETSDTGTSRGRDRGEVLRALLEGLGLDGADLPAQMDARSGRR